MTKANTYGFRMLPSYYEAIRDLPDPERLRMYDAIMDYGFGNAPGQLPASLRGIFGLIRPTLAKSIKFEAKQVENGKKGGRPSKASGNPPETHAKPNENLDVAFDVAVDNEGAVDTDELLTHMYGEYGWVELTDTQYQKLLAEIGQAELDRCIRYVDESAQATGNRNSWRDWSLVLRRCAREGWGLHNAPRGSVDIRSTEYYTYQEGESL